MTQAIKNLSTLIESMQPRLHEQPYVFCQLQDVPLQDTAALDPFALIMEREGMTAIVPEQLALQNSLSFEGRYAGITLEVFSSLDAIGLTAAISSALAEHNISVNVVAAFSHDHLFVGWESRQKALAVLHDLARGR